MLRIIGISEEEALTQYNILSVSDFIENMCIMQVTKVLHSQEHTLPASLRTTRRTHSNFPFDLPIARTEKFNNSAVIKTLRRTRDSSIVAHKPDQASHQLTTGRAQIHRCVRLVKKPFKRLFYKSLERLFYKKFSNKSINYLNTILRQTLYQKQSKL